MMNPREQAGALRSEGLSHARIAARLGVSKSTVYRWLDANLAERDRVFSRAYKNRHKPEMAAAAKARYVRLLRCCAECGNRCLTHRAAGDICKGCVERRANERRETIQRLWREGLSAREIASTLGRTNGSIKATITAMRAAGWDLPYRYKVRAAA